MLPLAPCLWDALRLGMVASYDTRMIMPVARQDTVSSLPLQCWAGGEKFDTSAGSNKDRVSADAILVMHSRIVMFAAHV